MWEHKCFCVSICSYTHSCKINWGPNLVCFFFYVVNKMKIVGAWFYCQEVFLVLCNEILTLTCPSSTFLCHLYSYILSIQSCTLLVSFFLVSDCSLYLHIFLFPLSNNLRKESTWETVQRLDWTSSVSLSSLKLGAGCGNST